MNSFDYNNVLYPLAMVLSGICLVSGFFLVLRSIIVFRRQITRSVNMDLEVVRVTKILKDKNQVSDKDAWKQEIGAMEQLLATLANLKDKQTFWRHFLYDDPYISMEIANPSSSEEIFFYFSVPKKYRESIEKQIHSYFPHASVEKVTDYTIFTPGSYAAAATLVLKESYALPLTTYKKMSVDPLNEISNALSKLETIQEGAAMQLVLKPAGKSWRKVGMAIAHKMQQGKRLNDVHHSSVIKEITKDTLSFLKDNDLDKALDKKAVQLTPEEQELVKSIEGKSIQAGFHVNVRLVASAGTQGRADEILAHLENSFSQFENAQINHFIVKKRLKSKKVIFDFIFRNFDEDTSVVLSAEEIAGIFHLPISTTETPKIKWLKSGAAPPPLNIPKEGLVVGYNDYRNVKTDIRLSPNDRRRHLYTIGQTGTGKSNFLQEMAKQDARMGNGFCFIDPHGDAIEDILTAVPKERAEDVIVFDPSDIERPFGLNMLEYDQSNPQQKTFVINEMIGIFDQLYDLKATGGPMFEQYVRNAMLLIMEDPDSGSTLMEISKVLADEDFRKMKLSKCTNPIVRDFWIKEAEKAGGEAALANMVPYITSKLTTFISNDMMRPIIAQQKSTLNFREIMDTGKILLVKLSKGKIGEINAHLLGMVVVGKILMNALARGDVPEEQRKDFYLYLDEFQNVTTNSISQILSEARKYHLCLIIAHQFIGQLSEDISKAVFGNVGSMVALRVGPEDAEFLEKQFAPTFVANDMVNVDNYNGFARLLLNGESTKPFNVKFYPPTKGDQVAANYYKELSRLKYGRDARIVNREIMERVRLAEGA